MSPEIAALLSIADFLLGKVEQGGGDIPENILADRTTIRRALVEQANNLSDPDPND